MFNFSQLRSLLMALYGLVVMVSFMLLLVAVMAWCIPDSPQPQADTDWEGPSSSEPPASVAKAPSADVNAGGAIFAANCRACHSTSADRIVGPGLAYIRQRSPDEAWLQKWIRNSSALIASGDVYAVKIFNVNGKLQMPSFTALTDLQIKQILDYVDSEKPGSAMSISAN